MNKKKILTLALCGTLTFSVSGAAAAAEGVSGIDPGKEKMLSVISERISENTHVHVRKISSLVKAAVQVAKAEEEAQKAAEAAAEEEKVRQEAAAAEEKEKAEAEERAKKDTEEARKKVAEGSEDGTTVTDAVPASAGSVRLDENNFVPYTEKLYASTTAPQVEEAAEAAYEDAVYTAPLYTEPSYVEPLYAAPVYTEPVYTEPVYTEPVYTEPVYTEPVYTEPVYTEPVYTDETVSDTLYVGSDAAEPVYEEPVYDASVFEEPVYDASAAVYDDGTYTEETSTETEASDAEVRATASDSDLDLLASIIYCEAGGESYEGQVAVGAVVLNRMESELYPDDMSDVIYQSGQFTPAMTGWLDQVRSSGVPDYCYDAAQAALAGENPVGDCLYFHAGGGDGLTIGNQTFY